MSTQSSPLVVRDSHKDTLVGVHAQKESVIAGFIILLTSASIKDPFPAWKPPVLMPKRTSEGQEIPLVGGFG